MTLKPLKVIKFEPWHILLRELPLALGASAVTDTLCRRENGIRAVVGAVL